ncbi:MAG TPA: phosphatase PAP2 family protein [Arthrobacter sp.]
MPVAQHEPSTSGAPLVRSQRALFFGAAGLLVAGEGVFWVVLAAVQSNSGLAAWDGPVHDGLAASRNTLATAALAAVATVTSPWWLTVTGAAVAAAWGIWRRELWRPALLAGAMAATLGLSTFIQHQVNRARPSAGGFLLGPDDGLSFPSGHTLSAGVFLLVLTYLLVSGRRKSPTAVLAVAAASSGTLVVALSRIYLGYDWLTDVLAAVGLTVAVVGCVILADGLRAASRAVPEAPRPGRHGRGAASGAARPS